MGNICKFNLDTFEYNIDSNLKAMLLPTPSDLYGTATTVLGALKAVDEALHLNPKATIPSKVAIGASGILAAGWAGAVLGSAIMAANRATTCDRKQVEELARELGLWGGWIDEAFNQLDW